jgi:hypothetical protein
MVHQFTNCYAANSRATVPARLCLAGLKGQLAAGYDAVCGTDKWAVRGWRCVGWVWRGALLRARFAF